MILPFLLSQSFVGLPQRRGALTFVTSRFDDLLDGIIERQNSTFENGASATSSTWKTVDWDSVGVELDSMESSPVDEVLIRGRRVFFKRDDLLRLPGSQISGNKARKLLALDALENFPDTIVSYGGPQSNAMLALAAIAHFRNVAVNATGTLPNSTHRFVYYTKTLPRFLKKTPSGNFFRAQQLGMELRELSVTEYNEMFGGDFGGSQEAPPALDTSDQGDSLWVPQGGASGVARLGTRLLAVEILSFWKGHSQGRPLSVIVPGGTCTTAVLVQEALLDLQANETDSLDIQVVVIPCVGDAGYARRQMLNIAKTNAIPSILPPEPKSDSGSFYQFGEPHNDILQTQEEILETTDITLDLLYGSPAWTILLRHWRGTSVESLGEGREIMYVHSGGLEGVSTQRLRYNYKGLLNSDAVQRPN